jgi:ubiquinone/menaquinone biosynthesis C-methylase UbiE
MSYFLVSKHLPAAIFNPLFGDRARFGTHPDRDDPTWKEWLDRGVDFYNANQRQSAGKAVNLSGYKVMRRVPLSGMRVLEIGPGALDHIRFWQDRPQHFTCLDNNAAFLDIAVRRLESEGIPHSAELLAPSETYRLPFPDASFDVVLSFYSLEHISPLEPYLAEIERVLKPGGILAGAIPCEGGLAWGVGRYLTSRRWLKRHTSIDPDRLICWEHPNFADRVLDDLDRMFDVTYRSFWPLRVPLVDTNLIARFVCYRR